MSRTIEQVPRFPKAMETCEDGGHHSVDHDAKNSRQPHVLPPETAVQSRIAAIARVADEELVAALTDLHDRHSRLFHEPRQQLLR